jgi:glycerophosphoryl diester phosphodiesterase
MLRALLIAVVLLMLTTVDAAGATCPESVTHRGNSSVAPENTLPALHAGAGADYVEFDVRSQGPAFLR